MPSSVNEEKSLERKLKMLESRFTAPPSSPATLLPDIEDSKSRSQHSFGFDVSSAARDTSVEDGNTNPCTPTPSWVKMTEQYMSKVAAEDPTILTGHTETPAQNHLPVSAQPSKRVLVRESPPAKENSSPPSKLMQPNASHKRKSIAPVKRQPSAKAASQPARKRNRQVGQNSSRHAETSRDGTSSKHKQNRSRSPNNSKILDFFSSKNPPKRSIATTSITTTINSPTSNNKRLHNRIEQLETELHDAKSQLTAVSNNRTIQHSQLQSALQQTQKELDATNALAQNKARRYQEALVEHIRQNAIQTARTKREALAAATNRLGRFTKGWRNQQVWEDGSDMVMCRATVSELHQRQTKLREHLKELDTRKTSQTLASVSEYESTLYQLRICVREREDIEKKLSQLRKEQVSHQKALSLATSEDSSVFRDHRLLDERYVLCSMLGKGGFSEVWKAFDVVELDYVAVKVHALDSRWSDAKKESYTKHVSREYEIQRQVEHTGIISLKAVFEIDNNSFATVLSLCNGIDLDALLKTKGRLSEEDARAILLQTLSAMLYLATPDESTGRQAIIHYDLKPANILLDEQGCVKITDFGLSKIMAEDDGATSMELTSQGAGTYWYLPPECFTDNARISNKVDVWSIGVIYFQMLFGKRPFGDGQSQERILSSGTMLKARSVTFPDSSVVGDDCKEFIRACLTYDQTFRPTIPEICKHPYALQSSVDVASEKP